MFRYPVHPAGMFAAVIGLYILLMVILVNVIVADVYDRGVNNFVLLLYGYAGLGTWFMRCLVRKGIIKFSDKVQQKFFTLTVG